MGCNYANNPDSFGGYRSPESTQIKHHFFWKVLIFYFYISFRVFYMSNKVVTQLGFVFDGLQYTRDIKDLKLLLIEDDHYLMPDSIHMIRQLSKK